MKYLLIAFLFISCSKSKTKCYECKATGYSGTGGQVDPQTKNVCTDNVDTVTFKDANGNPLNHSCTEK